MACGERLPVGPAQDPERLSPLGVPPEQPVLQIYVDIFYVLGDLSGAEWAEICGIEKLTAIQWIKRAALRVDWAKQPHGSPDGPEPLERTLIEDEATLLIKVRRIGWFRITLFEDERKGCRFPSRQVEHRNGGWADRRYFKIRKLLRAPAGGP